MRLPGFGTLNKDHQFSYGARRSTSIIHNSLILKACYNSTLLESHVAIVASKKVGKANLRNLAKRRLRFLIVNFLTERTYSLKSNSYIFILNNKIKLKNVDFLQLKNDFLLCIGQLENLKINKKRD